MITYLNLSPNPYPNPHSKLSSNLYSRRTKDRPAEKCLILIWRVTQSIYSQYKQYSVKSLKRLLRRCSNVMHIPFDTEKAFVIV